MRAGSETRRQAILETAATVFQETGFERTTMSASCERLGHPKATRYNHFLSKQALFCAVVLDATEEEFQATDDAPDPTVQDLRHALQPFGQRFLTLIDAPQVQAVRRLMVAEAGWSDLGRQCYKPSPARSEADTADFLQHAMVAGQLRSVDARVAAVHLRELLEADWVDRFLFQVLQDPSAQDIQATVQPAVAVFMAAHGPSEGSIAAHRKD